ncbi:MAG: MFS transporter, partial [Clostridia bacterium]
MSEKLDEKRYVGAKEIRMYGIANGGQVFGYNLVTSYLSFFFVTVFGIDPKIVSIMFVAVGIWDTLNDPLMGSIIDKTRTRFGKLR